MTLITLLPLLRRFWPYALAMALALGLWHYHGAYKAQVALRAADKASYVAAQEIARQKAEQARAATEASYKALADQKDKKYATEIADARDASERYIASHRVRAETAQGGAGSAAAASQGSGPASPDRSSEAPFLVSVTPDDIRICTENTARLEKAREWALTLDGVK